MMKDKTEKNTSLIEISKNSKNNDTIKNKISQIEIRENSKYAPIKDKVEWPFDYEVNMVRFDSLNKNKLYFIKNKDDENCFDSKII